MKWIIALLAVLLLLLQYRLWLGDGSIPEVLHLQNEKEAVAEERAQLDERNAALNAEVQDLKGGLGAIEERARSELGMIGKDETFYQFVQPKKTPPADESAQAR
ncbi:MAG TPA: cell division protein FtsB [Gammaproteobacteria bacterium]|nr:cell division protein FtsB [Gammaproteobacteria bacterium]